MGSAASKAARPTSGSVARKYPIRPSPSTSATPTVANGSAASGPAVHPEPYASSNRDAAINQDASDPHFAQSLRSLGPVQPSEMLTPSSRFSQVLASKTSPPHGIPAEPAAAKNPALALLAARQRWQDLADREAGEVGRRGFVGRELMDAATLRRVLAMRERGRTDGEIETELDLKAGVVAMLGRKGVVSAAEP